MIKSPTTPAGTRAAIGFTHFATIVIFALVAVSGQLTLLAGVLWVAACAAVDQAAVWALWALGGKGAPGPNRGW